MKAKVKASWPVCCSSVARVHKVADLSGDPLNSDTIRGDNPIEARCTETEHCLPNETSKPEHGPTEYPKSIEDSGSCYLAYPSKTLSGGNRAASYSANVSDSEYGIISLFDGVSTAVPIIQKKLGYAPVVTVLAEMDVSLRALVCAEFGYRTDQAWGRAKNGSVGIYFKDVSTLLDNRCQLLQEAVALAPNAKWIIVGGSPCQDLTFAGTFKGLLGLVGQKQSFFLYPARSNSCNARISPGQECTISCRKCWFHG